MTDKDEAHLGRVIDWACKSISKKYRNGVIEHAGHLPNKPGLLHCAENEAIDQMVYLETVREQVTFAVQMLEAGRYLEAENLLRGLLAPSKD